MSRIFIKVQKGVDLYHRFMASLKKTFNIIEKRMTCREIGHALNSKMYGLQEKLTTLLNTLHL